MAKVITECRFVFDPTLSPMCRIPFAEGKHPLKYTLQQL